VTYAGRSNKACFASAVEYACALGTWRSLVAHLLWEQGVAGSNPAVPMARTRSTRRLVGMTLVVSRAATRPYGKKWSESGQADRATAAMEAQFSQAMEAR
jgi:hypothetical protein